MHFVVEMSVKVTFTIVSPQLVVRCLVVWCIFICSVSSEGSCQFFLPRLPSLRQLSYPRRNSVTKHILDNLK